MLNGTFEDGDVEISGLVRARILPAGSITLWVRGRDAAGNWGPAAQRTFQVNGEATVGVEDDVPLQFALEQNAPNPVKGAGTLIRYALPRSGRVELSVFGVRGERIRTVASEFQAAGRRSIVWDRRDDSGRRVPSGVYFYRLQLGNEHATRKMVLMN